MSKLRCIACCSLLTAVFFGTSVIAQEFPFNGTWKIDIDAVAEQLSTANRDEKERELIAMKLDRMKSLRYILIEFWATWCSPCLRKMPRLVELQKEIGQDRLAIVAISPESRERLTGFLDREGTNKETAGSQVLEHSKSISIGVDRDSSTLRAYMVATGFRAIPTLFIVGKSGQVEWAGSSEDCEAVLRQVLEGSWDRQLFFERFAGIQRAYLEFPRLVELVGKERHEDALKLIEELFEVADDQMKANLEAMRARVQKQRTDN